MKEDRGDANVVRFRRDFRALSFTFKGFLAHHYQAGLLDKGFVRVLFFRVCCKKKTFSLSIARPREGLRTLTSGIHSRVLARVASVWLFHFGE